MPPRRAAARKASTKAPTSTASQSQSAPKPPSKKPTSKGKKRAASPQSEDEDTKDKNSSENDKPKSKKAKLDDPPPKMVTVVKRGKAPPVDSCSPYVSSHEVYTDGKEYFDAMLNQTVLKANSNKFYAMQLLHPQGNDSSSLLFTRWGRVGETGQTQTKGPFTSSVAVREFYKQYKAKTGSDWADRATAAAKAGKYRFIERDFEDEEVENIEASGSGDVPARDPTPEIVAKPPIAELIRLIFNTQLMDAHLKELNYDANKLPLGKMSKKHILQGFEALQKLSDVINAPQGTLAEEMGGFDDACDTLSGSYYSIIPHLFNRNTRPIAINNKELLKRELDLVDALSDMSLTTKLIQSATDPGGKTVNPVDSRLEGLNLESIEALERDGKEFAALESYARDTHGATHSHLKPKIQEIFKLKRKGESEPYEANGYHELDDGKRRLLWHGSRTTNFGGILSQGLRIAPPEAPVSGYMFGKGVYFADASSKSLGYTYHHLSNNTGLLLLCEVATDPFLELNDAAYDADKLCKDAKSLATKGVGRTQPNEWQDAGEATGNEELKGVWMPKGALRNSNPAGAYLQYNEYIVYQTSQIRLRYLLRVGF